MLAEKDNQSKEIILAALLHDIGHLVALNNNNFTLGANARFEQINLRYHSTHFHEEYINYDYYNLGFALKFLDHRIGTQKSHGLGLDFGFLLNNWKSSKLSFIKDITTSWQVWNNGTIERTKPSIVSGFSHSLFFNKIVYYFSNWTKNFNS